VGTRDVQVMYEGQRAKLPLVIVKGNGLTLLGRNLLNLIGVKSIIQAVLGCRTY